MANTHHTGIPKLQWTFEYPPCTPSVTIVADKNPFCLGDSVTFTPTFNCVDTATIESYEIKYGALYNWYAATDVRNICAEGWEVPSVEKWETLQVYLGGLSVAGRKLKETGFTYWSTPNVGATNEVGFNGRGSGRRSGPTGGTFDVTLGGQAYFWTPYFSGTCSVFVLSYNNDNFGVAFRYKADGLSIRPVKTTTTLAHGQTGTYTGNDGKVYRTICIGTQEWLADNLAETLYRDLTPIPEVTDNAEWAALEDGAMCYYNNDINNAYTYTNDSEIISYGWVVNGSIQSTSAEPFVTNTLTNGNSVYMFFITSIGQTYFSNVITMQEKTEGCEEPGLELTFDNISNVPVADASSVSDWNTFFDLPTNGNPFTSVVVDGDKVILIGGSGITGKTYLFYETSTLIRFDDQSGCIIELALNCIFGEYYCEYVSLPNCTNIGQANFSEMLFDGIEFILPNADVIGAGCFDGSNFHILELPECTSIGNGAFSMNGTSVLPNITSISMPKLLNLGSTVGYNSIFNMSGYSFTLTIPAALMTCNGGNPDGDIQYLQANNTVTIITV